MENVMEKANEAAPNINAWASLLGLLSPKEYFITVDHSVLWQRHVAWAKPNGKDLRQYVTQRFASNMVVLSLMLGAEISVFFCGSTHFLMNMRAKLASEDYGDLKFWIGIVIALDAVVTIMALIATFTLWGMISSISDANTHALLRSTIGQYVISMPPRFVVAALYLFIFWLWLAFMDMLSGPSRIFLSLVVMYLFFHVILPLSAFGRIIIDTGAMAQRRVLEKDFEKELLPSGLHASLLIRATGQRRKYSSTISQYRKQFRRTDSDSSQPDVASQWSNMSSNMSEISKPIIDTQSQSVRSTLSERDLMMSLRSQASSAPSKALLDPDDDEESVETNNLSQSTPNGQGFTPLPMSMRPTTHQRSISGDVSFPCASILNSAEDANLPDLVMEAIRENERDAHLDVITEEESPKQQDAASPSEKKLDVEPIILEPKATDDTMGQIGTTRPHRRAHRRSRSSIQLTKGTSSRRLMAEWEVETSVRDLYHEAAPAMLVPRSSPSYGKKRKSNSRKPRASLLNRALGLRALADLVTHKDLDTPESSVASEGEDEEDPSPTRAIIRDDLVGRVFTKDPRQHFRRISSIGTPKMMSAFTEDIEYGTGETQNLLNRNLSVEESGASTKYSSVANT